MRFGDVGLSLDTLVSLHLVLLIQRTYLQCSTVATLAI